MYLSYQFNDSFCILQGHHLFLIYILTWIEIVVYYLYNLKRKFPSLWKFSQSISFCRLMYANIYLYSDSKSSVILTSSAMAIFSSCINVGDTLPFSMLLSVDFPNPVFSASCTRVNCFSVLFSHNVTCILSTSFHSSVQDK